MMIWPATHKAIFISSGCCHSKNALKRCVATVANDQKCYFTNKTNLRQYFVETLTTIKTDILNVESLFLKNRHVSFNVLMF